MQTFLPYPDFTETAKCLDYRRLGKQRLESMEILFAINDKNYGWQNHPAVNMWRGYELALLHYALEMCHEWKLRGYEDNIEKKLVRMYVGEGRFRLTNYPEWLGREDFHASHRSNLLRKKPEYYSKFGWSEPDNLPYVWPV